MNGHPVRQISRSELRQIVQAIRQSKDRWFVLPRLLAAVNPLLGLGPTVHRPKIVFFGEAMAEPAWSHSLEAAKSCDLMLVVGTSGEVYPACTLPEEASRAGARIVCVGPEPTTADVWIPGKAGEILPELLDLAFARGQEA
jgi:NAD-dependent SIR2 family protein deacetylase